MWDVIVIGGGASGMWAAYTAALRGRRVLLMERNEKLGKKLYITGKGRCNVTNASPMESFMQSVPRNPRFLFAAFDAFPNTALMRWLEDNGVPVKVERGNRVFPQSDRASDITRALEKALRREGVSVRFHARVTSLLRGDDGHARGVVCDGEAIEASSVVIATGGASYPSTGSTGDGYRLAQEAGHTVVEAKASLVPMETREAWPMQLQGLSLRNVRFSASVGGKIAFDELGELLFTHFGISGPLVLSCSSHIADVAPASVTLSLDMKPGLSQEQLDLRLQRDFQQHARKPFRHAFSDLLPSKMAPVFAEITGIAGDKPTHQITKEERRHVAALLKAIPLPIARLRPVEEGIVTRGGISVKEIQPSTMMSKRAAGLYFAGEVIDVDAHTGGYNLQIAFSTGYVAGMHC